MLPGEGEEEGGGGPYNSMEGFSYGLLCVDDDNRFQCIFTSVFFNDYVIQHRDFKIILDILSYLFIANIINPYIPYYTIVYTL